MRNSQKYCILIMLIGLFFICNNVYAADALYRFMHNDHDALIIGEITSIKDGYVKVRVAKNIISAKNLNEAHPKKQLKLKEATIKATFGYAGFYNKNGARTVNPSVGDYVLLSLIKSGNTFVVGWGAYKVDSLDNKKLSIVLPEDTYMGTRMDAAAIKIFVNSDGKITEFAFDGEKKIVYAGKEKQIIFNGNTYKKNNNTQNNNKKTSQYNNKIEDVSLKDKKNTSNSKTSEFLAENQIKTLVISILIVAIILVSVFTIKYIAKKRHLQ